MRININNYVPFLQEGGEIPADQGAPVDEVPAGEGAPVQGGGDPMQELLMAAQQALQTQDCNIAMQVCQVLMQLAGGGQEAPAAPEGQPVYKMGGRLSRWIKK